MTATPLGISNDVALFATCEDGTLWRGIVFGPLGDPNEFTRWDRIGDIPSEESDRMTETYRRGI